MDVGKGRTEGGLHRNGIAKHRPDLSPIGDNNVSSLSVYLLDNNPVAFIQVRNIALRNKERVPDIDGTQNSPSKRG